MLHAHMYKYILIPELMTLQDQCHECTKVQNPHYKDVTLNAYTSA